MLRSSSVSPPSMVSSTSFPSWFATSRTTRGRRLKIRSSGIIRIPIMRFWRSETERPTMESASSNSLMPCFFAICSSRPRLMTRSSTRFIIRSSRWISTRMFLISRLFSAFAARCTCCGDGSGVWASLLSAGGVMGKAAGSEPPAERAMSESSVPEAIVLSASSPASLSIRTSNGPSNFPSSRSSRAGVVARIVPSSSRFCRSSIARTSFIVLDGSTATVSVYSGRSSASSTGSGVVSAGGAASGDGPSSPSSSANA